MRVRSVGLVVTLAVILLTRQAKAVDVITPEERRIAASFSPALPQVLESGKDMWGEAAMREPNGPSYDFFKGLLPPIRYVNADFRYYPLVLSAPRAWVKARLTSNGSAVNAPGNLWSWKDIGTPTAFKVGEGEVFGSNLRRLDGPHYEKGYLPVVRMSYRDHDTVYEEQAFASTNSEFEDAGSVFLKFSLLKGKNGRVSIQPEHGAEVYPMGGTLRDQSGHTIVWFDRNWRWDPHKNALTASLKTGSSAVAAVFTAPVEHELSVLSVKYWDEQRKACEKTWEDLLSKGMRVQTPEQVVNHAWRSVLIANFELIKNDLICYSNGNQYEKIYINEGGDAARSFLLWGYGDEAKRLMIPIMDFQRAGLLFHQAGLKLQMLSHYYWLTHNAAFIKEQKDRWNLQIDRVLHGRESESGLFPKEKYCGDIETNVYSLNSNANSWRGLRDFGAVLADMGLRDQGDRLLRSADRFRPAILSAVEKSVRKDVTPPFVPIALFGEEQPYDFLPATKLGGYYDLIAPLVLGSGVLGYQSEETGWMMDYMRQHGGLCIGLVRCHPRNELYTVKQGVNDLYSLRYVLTVLQRDEPERALVSFYGKLAQGFTPETFVGGEATGIVPLDEFGRPMYMPPNSAGNSFFLWMLRYLLVQDWDLDDDGTPDTLRLMFATPRRWLEDGKVISIERAPTAFGKVSVAMRSMLRKGKVIADVTAPEREPQKMLLRARVPDGWQITTAECEGKTLTADAKGTVDLSGIQGKFTVTFSVRQELPSH